jgi:hypothetical protein
MNVLVSLYKGYGLGDAVAISAVLRHVVAARPEWVIDYQAEEGKHQVGRGIAASTFAYGAPHPSDHYDAEMQVRLYDTWRGYDDRPNTRASSCLEDYFGLDWNARYGRYSVAVSEESVSAARTLLYGGGRAGNTLVPRRAEPGRVVAIHYQGDSAPARKNLSCAQADEVCRAVEELGWHPIILDWRARSELPYRKLRTPVEWGRDAEMVCAVVAQCAAFVGIDSGPTRCAGATDVPSLVVWTGHSPIAHCDPAPNVTHLVPANYRHLEPVCGHTGAVAFFEANYRARTYERDPVPEVRRWLEEVLV